MVHQGLPEGLDMHEYVRYLFEIVEGVAYLQDYGEEFELAWFYVPVIHILHFGL